MAAAWVEQSSGQGMDGERLLAMGVATAQAFHHLSLSAGGGSAHVGGAFCWHSRSYVAAFNGAGLFDIRLYDQKVLTEIDEFFAKQGRPYSLLVLDGLVPGSSELMKGLGYVEYDSSPLMCLEGSTTRWDDAPERLHITLVETPAQMGVFREIVSDVFHISQEEVGLVLNDRALEVLSVRHYLGWVGKIPVASASMVLERQIPGVPGGRVSGIWNVATLRDFRRRGIAAEIMHYMVRDALRLGYQVSMLLASSQGLPLYERLGYTTLTTVRTFAPRKQWYWPAP